MNKEKISELIEGVSKKIEEEEISTGLCIERILANGEKVTYLSTRTIMTMIINQTLPLLKKAFDEQRLFTQEEEKIIAEKLNLFLFNMEK